MNKSAVHSSYQAWSNIYDSQENPTRDCSTAVLKTILPDLTGLSIVEAGCGTGWNTHWLAPICQQLIGLDFSENMLALAKQKVNLPHVQLHVHDLMKPWPIAQQWADLVLINLVIEHIDNLDPLIKNAAEVLKEGGTIVITEYHPDRVKKGSGAEFQSDNESLTEIINFWHPLAHYKEAASDNSLRIDSVKTWRKTVDEKGQPVETSNEPLLLSLTLVKN